MEDRDDPAMREILEGAARVPLQERSSFLDRACAGNPELRSEIESLLRSLSQADGFLVEPTLDPAAPQAGFGAPSDLATSVTLSEGLGSRIGHYELRELIGEGGFGSVFMAEQQAPVRRTVALKIIKPGMDTKQVIARFEAERQALAMMDHPNIAHVYDAGATQTGRPYFVMELVSGVPITQYCDKHHLTPRERLRLFLPVCQAVQHAHTKGIIHRDLKPSNILVMLSDGKPVPKVIDFGVAKALHQKLTEKTLFTHSGHMVGTPEYMSPEQTDLDVAGADTRSDIYSLGVLLYELLTGSTPFTPKELREAGYAQMLRLIREREPPTPSTRLSASGETLESVSALRGTEPRKLTKLVCGDLDWIAMKCLEKERSRRYETAAALGRDIERYLNDEPVEASPPSRVYKLRKFTRKHRLGLRVAAGFVLLLIAATAVSATAAILATRARKASAVAESNMRAERDRADTQAAIARAVNDFFNQDVLALADPHSQADKYRVVNRDLKVRDALDRAATRVSERFAAQPLVEAAVRRTIGNAYMGLGEYDKARLHLERTLTLLRQFKGESDPDMLGCLEELGALYCARGEFGLAESLLMRLSEQASQVYGQEDPRALSPRAQLAEVYRGMWRFDKAEAIDLKLLDSYRRTEGNDGPHTLDILNNLGEDYEDTGQPQKAEPLYLEAWRGKQRSFGESDPTTLETMHNLGLHFVNVNQLEKGKPLLEAVLREERRIFGDEHPGTLVTMSSLGLAEARLGHYDRAESLLRQSLDGMRKVLGDQHTYQTFWARERLKTFYEWRGKYANATALLEEAAAGISTRLARPNLPAVDVAQLLSERSRLYLRLGRVQDALPDCVQCAKLNPEDHWSWYRLACVQEYLGANAEYRNSCREMLRRFRDSNDPPIADRIAKSCLLAPNAVEDLSAVVHLAQRSLRETLPNVLPYHQLATGMAAYRAGDWAAAVDWLTRSVAGFVRLLDGAPIAVRQNVAWDEGRTTANFFLAMAELHLGHEERARAVLALARNQLRTDFPPLSSGKIKFRTEDYLIVHIAAREADAMFGPESAATQPRTRPADENATRSAAD